MCSNVYPTNSFRGIEDYFSFTEKYLEMSLDDKRSHYKCKNKYQELSTIPTWTEYFQKNRQEKQYSFTEWRKSKV